MVREKRKEGQSMEPRRKMDRGLLQRPGEENLTKQPPREELSLPQPGSCTCPYLNGNVAISTSALYVGCWVGGRQLSHQNTGPLPTLEGDECVIWVPLWVVSRGKGANMSVCGKKNKMVWRPMGCTLTDTVQFPFFWAHRKRMFPSLLCRGWGCVTSLA